VCRVARVARRSRGATRRATPSRVDMALDVASRCVANLRRVDARRRFPRRRAVASSSARDLLDAIAREADDDAIRARVDALTEAFDVARAFGGDGDAVAAALHGTWRLAHASKSAFDPRAPLGRRTDATTPGLEAAFATLFDDANANASGSGSGSSSPIQRAVLSKLSDGGFAVRQGVRLRGEARKRRVDQAVCFGDGYGWFRLSANARLDAREGRIDYGFDLAYVDLKKPIAVRVPYPVPFRLLGKEAMGYLTCDYVGDGVRVCTGNKGTTFVFVKEDDDALPYANEFYD
jgi:hypothetical protein